MYKVVSDFRDLKNNNYVYRAGDEYPVSSYKPTKARIEELAKGKNKYGKVFIEEVNGEKSSTDDISNKYDSAQTEKNKSEK